MCIRDSYYIVITVIIVIIIILFCIGHLGTTCQFQFVNLFYLFIIFIIFYYYVIIEGAKRVSQLDFEICLSVYLFSVWQPITFESIHRFSWNLAGIHTFTLQDPIILKLIRLKEGGERAKLLGATIFEAL